MNFKYLLLITLIVIGSVVLSACGGSQPVVTTLRLSPLNDEQANRGSNFELDYENLSLPHTIIFVVADNQYDPTGSLVEGENSYLYDIGYVIPTTIEENSVDSNAYIDIHQDFEGGALKGYVIHVPLGEKDKYIQIFEVGEK